VDLGLAGATVVVQGGSKGMGRAAAERFAAEGAKVGVLARNRETIDETVAQLLELGAADAVALPADITKPDEVTAAFDTVATRWGSLNILVNAAGPTAGLGGFEQLTDADWFAAIDTGAMGMIRCVRAALPLLRAAEWARIVNLSAQSTKRQSPGLVAYTAAKAVVTSVTKNLAQSLASEEILVNTVSPGAVISDGMAGLARRGGVDPDDPYAVMRLIAEQFGHPAFLPRAGTPPELGDVIAFVASRRNSYMTGANINVDGGSDFS
jgi:NAD(P)-dependent dehydrogenase (short-subunit alcohol dehydrogenase family)